MFNEQIVLIHTFIYSCSQYKNIKYPEHCKVDESGERRTQREKKGPEFCETCSLHRF